MGKRRFCLVSVFVLVSTLAGCGQGQYSGKKHSGALETEALEAEWSFDNERNGSVH